MTTDNNATISNINRSYSAIRVAFNRLQQTLLRLDNLPLAIVNVKCTSAYYRQTKALPPSGVFAGPPIKDQHVENFVTRLDSDGPIPPFLPSVKVLISLQRNNKWGDDLDVIAKLKAVFYVNISRRLRVNHELFTVATDSELYVIVDRIVFCLRIVHLREVQLFAAAKKNGQDLSKYIQSYGVDFALRVRRDLIHKPLVSQLLYSLSQRNSAFSECCMLARQWFDACYLSKVFEGIAIELLIARLFTATGNAPPKNGKAAFARFVAFLAMFNFASEPVVVDINERFTPDVLDAARRNFIERRLVLPPVVILTPEDHDGIIFTSRQPETVALLRVIQFAKTMHEQINALALEKADLNEFEMPKPNTHIYDVLILMDRKHMAYRPRATVPAAKDTGAKNTARQPKNTSSLYALPVVDFEPARMLFAELRTHFSKKAMFFFNASTCRSIGVVFRPTFLTGRDATDDDTSNQSTQRRPIKGEERRKILKTNVAAFVEDVKILAGKFVYKVVVSPQFRYEN